MNKRRIPDKHGQLKYMRNARYYPCQKCYFVYLTEDEAKNCKRTNRCRKQEMKQ